MTKIAIIRCDKNMDRCPLTNCFRCLTDKKEGYAHYEETAPVGVFTCRCPGDNTTDLAKILKSKGAEVIHFCTCTFSKKNGSDWDMANGGFCDHIDDIIDKVHLETGIPCVKGTAHLPVGYELKIWK